MTIAEWCIFASVMLYLLTIAPIKWLGFRQFDNANPRDPAFYENPLRARALGAHLNGIETFPFFAAAVLLAEFREQPAKSDQRTGGAVFDRADRLCLHLSRRPADAAVDPVEHRLCDQCRDFLSAGDQGYLPA